MANRSDIEAGAAYIRLYVKNSELLKGLALVKQEMKLVFDGINRLGQGMIAMGQKVSRVGGLVATTMGAITASLAFPIKAAGDLAETVSKFEAVFGANSEAMRKWAEDFAAAVGRSKSETLASLSTFQAFFTGLGLSADKAKSLSQQMHTLAIDFGSFHNVSDPEAIQRFISAMSGSSEVLDMFGINIKQAALDQKLLAMGFPSVAKGATEVQKVMARMAIIREAMGRQGAVGDALRTSGSFSNQLKALQGEIRNTTEAIGTALMPVITPLVGQLRQLAQAVGKVITNNLEMVVTFAKVASISTVVGAGIFAIGKAITLVGYGFTGLSVLMSPTIGMISLMQLAFTRTATSAIRMAVSIGSAMRQARSHLGMIAGGAGQIAGGIGQIGFAIGSAITGSITSALRSAGPMMVSALRVAGSGLMSVAQFHAGQIAAAFAPLGSLIAAKLAPVSAVVGKTLRGPFLEAYLAAQIAAERIKAVWQPLAAVASAAAARVASAWRVASTTMATALTTQMSAAFARIRAMGISTAATLRAGLGGIGRGLGGIATGAAGLLGMFASSAGGILGTVAMVVPQVLLLGASLTMLANPATLVVAAIAGGVAAWARFTESGQKAVGFLMETFKPFIDFGRQLVQGISDAFAAGDLELAGRVAMAGIMLAVAEAKVYILEKWVSIKNAVIEAIGTMYREFSAGVAFMQSLWGTFSEKAPKKFLSNLEKATKGWEGFKLAGASAFTELLSVGNSVLKLFGKLFDAMEKAVKGAAKMGNKSAQLLTRGGKKLFEASTGVDVDDALADAKAEAKRVREEIMAEQAGPREERQRADEELVGKSKDDAAAAKAEFDAFTADAAKRKEDMYWSLYGSGEAANLPKQDDIIAPDVSAMRGNASAATFSAAAISGMFGGGGGPQERIASTTDKVYQKIVEQIRMQQRQERILEAIQRGIVVH